MSVGCVEPGIWRLFQNAAGEYPHNSVRAREIRRNNRLRLTLAAPRLLLVMAKNSVYASYTSNVTETTRMPVEMIPELLRSFPTSLSFCQHEITQALGFVQSHFHPTIDLPGPTGESNRLSMEPVGTVLCVQGDNEAFWVAQVVQSLLLGNTVIMAGHNASSHCEELSQWLAQTQDHSSNTDNLQAMDTDLNAESLKEFISSAELDAVAISDGTAIIRTIRQLLSMRDGPIVSIAGTLFDISPLVSEKSLCIDTTAAGGNASLLASAS